MIKKSLLLLVLTLSATSCYRMPSDDDCSMIPSTNNRDYTREKGKGAPGLPY